MKVYLDTNILGVQIFGGFSEVEQARFQDVQILFKKIDGGDLDATVSFYTLQEIYTVCAEFCEEAELETFARDVLLEILQHRIGIFRLLTRKERLVHRTQFSIRDTSDEPHVVAAFLSECDAIVTYDSHFGDVKSSIAVYSPAELIEFLSRS